MFRATENVRANGGADIEHDESNSAFSGATLKISGQDSITPEQDVQQGTVTSSVLSGSDGSAITGRENRTTNSERTGEGAEQPQPVVYVKPNKVGSPKNFFSFREGLLEHAVSDCINILLRPANDTDVIGTWLLTEISHWDNERERIFILTTRTLLEVKYDFISLRILQNSKIRLNQIDTIINGKITYPGNSLIPTIGGLTNGVVTMISDGFNACKDYQRFSSSGLTVANRFDFTSFKPIERSEQGIRIKWNRGQPLNWMASWNPFANDIPWKTIIDHPLYSYKDPFDTPYIKEGLEKYKKYYSVEALNEALIQTIQNENFKHGNRDTTLKIEEGPIMMENYVGIAAMIHNKNNFGFFKVRGKFSF